MLNQIKTYFRQKRELRELLLDTVQKANHIASALSDFSDSVSAAAKAFDTDALKELMDSINKIADSGR